MPRFRYKAIAADGRTVEDVIEAADRDSALSLLRDGRRLPVAIDEDTGRLARGRPAPRPAQSAFLGPLLMLVEAGIAVDEALAILARGLDVRSAALAAVLYQRVRAGRSLSQALAAEGATFDPFALAVVRAGEGGGNLAASLRQLVNYLERAERLGNAVRTALIYPAILIAAAVVSLLLLLVFVVPQFESLFREAAVNLPPLTRAVLAISAALRDFGWAILLALVGAALLLRHRWDEVRRWWDGALMATKATAAIVQRIEAERFLRSLAALLRGGVAVQDAATMAAATVRNATIAARLAPLAGRLREGAAMAEALAQGSALPPLVVEFVRVGEATGTLAPALERLADSYAAEIEVALRRLVLLIEPVLILVVGAVVGLVVVSLLSALVGFNAFVL
jgi:general secretion pathway protein F